jgi:hypothetical protein
MAGDITPFIIRIQTALEKGGIEGAKTELAALTAEAEKSKKANEGASGSSDKLGQSVGKSAELVGSLTSAMAAGGPEAQQMGAGLRVLKAIVEGSSAGIMGLATVLVGAGVSAYVSYRGKVEEAKKKLEEFYAQIETNKRAQDAAGVDRMAGQYDALRKSVDEVTSAQDRLNQAQASADNAEKAARMADITLREKQAQNALKKDDTVGSAKVSAKFAGERRDLETEYAVRDAERSAAAKASALSDSEAKLRISGADVESNKQALAEFEARIRKVNEALYDLYGSGAPTKKQARYESVPGSPGVLRVSGYDTVVDKDEQSKRATRLQTQLKGTDKEPGLEANYNKVAVLIAAALERQAKEAVEVQARRIEAEAAVKVFDTTRQMTPRINAEETTAEGRKVREVTADRNQQLFRGRLEQTRRSSEQNYQSRSRDAAMIDASDFRRVGGRTYQEAKGIDKERDKQAAEAKRLMEAAKALEEQIKAMDPAALTRTFTSVSRKLDQLDKAIKDMDARAKRPGSGG